MIPAVFCASLPPCPRLYNAAETSGNRRNQRSTRLGVERTKSQDTASINSDPSRNPRRGETRIKATVFQIPAGISAQVPAFATAAPTNLPISACDEDEGMP